MRHYIFLILLCANVIHCATKNQQVALNKRYQELINTSYITFDAPKRSQYLADLRSLFSMPGSMSLHARERLQQRIGEVQQYMEIFTTPERVVSGATISKSPLQKKAAPVIGGSTVVVIKEVNPYRTRLVDALKQYTLSDKSKNEEYQAVFKEVADVATTYTQSKAKYDKALADYKWVKQHEHDNNKIKQEQTDFNAAAQLEITSIALMSATLQHVIDVLSGLVAALKPENQDPLHNAWKENVDSYIRELGRMQQEVKHHEKAVLNELSGIFIK